MPRRLIFSMVLLAGLGAVFVGGAHVGEALHKDWGHSGYLLTPSYLPDEVVVNSSSTHYTVTSLTDSFDNAAQSAAANWDSALRNYSPNYLGKDVFTWGGTDNPNANINVWAIPSDQHALHCGSATSHGCLEDDNSPNDNPPMVNLYSRPFWVIMDAGQVTLSDHKVSDTAHELGHALMFGEHGGGSYNCSSIMGHSSTENAQTYCSSTITFPTSHDRNDFWAAYKPQDSPSPTTVTINSSSQVTFNWTSANTDNMSQFYWAKESDVHGTVIQDGYVSRTTTSRAFSSLANGTRWCFRANAYSDAGFSGLDPWGPNTFYGCASRGTGPSAGGPFVAVTYRGFSGLEIRVKNYSGATRAMIVTGPGLGDNIGCTSKDVANGGTYSCTSSVAQGHYDHLTWWATSSGNASYGPVDYD